MLPAQLPAVNLLPRQKSAASAVFIFLGVISSIHLAVNITSNYSPQLLMLVPA